jgi:hypothetical protein
MEHPVQRIDGVAYSGHFKTVYENVTERVFWIFAEFSVVEKEVAYKIKPMHLSWRSRFHFDPALLLKRRRCKLVQVPQELVSACWPSNGGGSLVILECHQVALTSFTFHGNNISKSSTFFAWGRRWKIIERYACGSTPFALALSTSE